jgi:hypothetical protein
MATVLQTSRRRSIRQGRRLGYLEAGLAPPVATEEDPRRDTAPELARTLAASVQPRRACGDRAGQHGRRIGSGLGSEGAAPRLTGPRWARVHGFSLPANPAMPAHRRDQWAQRMRYTARGAVSLARLQDDTNGDLVSPCTQPWADGTTGSRLAPLALLEKLAALVPLPHVHLAPHSHLRGSVLPTPRQQGVAAETATRSPQWRWARLRHRGCARDRVQGPWWQRGTLRLIAVITQGAVIHKIRRHLPRAAAPPSIAPARSRQAPCDGVASGHDDPRGLVSHVRAVAAVAHLRVCALPAQGTPSRLPSLHRAHRSDWRVALEHPRLPTQKGF